MKIKDLSKEIIGGQIISRVEAKNENDKIIGEARIVIPKAINNSMIDHNNLAKINIKIELDKKRITQRGDIVLKLSQPYDAAYIGENDEGLLVTSYCIILRNLTDKINPLYFLALLNSELYKEQALELTSGATVPIITKGNIEKIDLHIKPIEEQEQIVSFSKKITKKEQLFNEVIKLEKMKLENMLRGDV